MWYAIFIICLVILLLRIFLKILSIWLGNKLNEIKREILVKNFKIVMGNYMFEQIKDNRSNLSSAYKCSSMCKYLDSASEVIFSDFENMGLDAKFKCIVNLNKIYRDKYYGQF